MICYEGSVSEQAVVVDLVATVSFELPSHAPPLVDGDVRFAIGRQGGQNEPRGD